MTKVSELKNENINAIRHCFYDQSIHTKNQLSQITGISLAAVTNVLQHLLKTQEVVRVVDACSTGGRKSKQYLLNRNYCHIASMIFKKTEDEYAFVLHVYDLFGDLCFEEIKKSKTGTVDDFTMALKTLLKNENIGFLSISIPGVCVSGMIKVCDFYCFENVYLTDLIRKYTDIPFVIENDVNVGVIGYSYHHPEIQNMVFLYHPAVDYVGCGILIEGKLYNGHTHAAGELRYLPPRKTKDPKKLLAEEIQVLKAVLDPQLIVWYSDVADDLAGEDRIEHLTDLYGYIQKGLFKIGLEQIKNGGK